MIVINGRGGRRNAIYIFLLVWFCTIATVRERKTNNSGTVYWGCPKSFPSIPCSSKISSFRFLSPPPYAMRRGGKVGRREREEGEKSE